MRKIIFLFIALFMGSAIKAQQIISKNVVEQAKAIVAYEMNVLSLRPNEKSSEKDKNLFEDFKKQASEKLTVDDVKECLPNNYTRSKKLCDDIKKMNSEFVNADAVAAYYSDSVFQQKGGAIEEFIKKRKRDDVDRLKKTIKKRIQEVTDKADILFDLEENVPEQPIEEEQGNTKDASEPLPDLTSDSSMDEAVSFVEILKKYSGYLMAFMMLVVAVILFRNSRSLEDECNELKENREKNDDLLRKRIAETKDMQDMINLLKQKNAELEEQNRVLQEDVKNLEEARRKQIRQSAATTICDVVSHKEEIKQNIPREYYLGVPQNGKFSEGSEIYRPGKVLYRMVSTDGVYGEFEYINRPEAIGYAKQSRTSFLESACNIIGEGKLDFVQIETKQKGKVERTNDGWKIIKKADVYLV